MNARILIGLIALPLAIGTLALSGCESGGAGGDSTLTLELTDAPGDDIAKAIVQIDEIYLQSETEGRLVLRDSPITVDLVELRNDTRTLVDAVVVPEGTYAQLRFVISGAAIEVDDGAHAPTWYVTAGDEHLAEGNVTGELKTPSWDASGLKIKLPDQGGLTVDTESRILLVDFDVAQSFQTQTGNGAWVMSPVVDAVDIGLTTTVDIEVRLGAGVILDSTITDLHLELLNADGVRVGLLALADPDDDGVYEVTFLYVDPREGPFSVRLVGPHGDLMPFGFDGAGQGIVGASGATVEVTLTIQGPQ